MLSDRPRVQGDGARLPHDREERPSCAAAPGLRVLQQPEGPGQGGGDERVRGQPPAEEGARQHQRARQLGLVLQQGIREEGTEAVVKIEAKMIW